MRVAFINSHPIQYHAKWFRALAEQPGLDVDVLYCHNATQAEQADAGFGVSFEWDVPLFDGYRYRFLRNAARQPSIASFSGLDTPELQTLIRGGQYDAVVTNGWHFKSAWQAIWACWQSGVPILVRSDSHLHTDRGVVKSLLKAAPYRAFIPRLDGCLPVGRWSADYFRYYGAEPNRVHIVPHVVDSTFESESNRVADQRPRFRESWGFGPEDTVFLFAGKFIAKKRPLDFVRAVHRAHVQNPRVVGLMVGDGLLRRDCEAAARESGLPIRFVGFLNQSEIIPAYVAADVLVLPSDGGETWGIVVNEAMSCGKPAFVSDRVGCGPDLVIASETGFIFPLGDVEVLSSLMTEGAADPNRLVAMGENARRRMRDYSVSVAVDRLTQALTRIRQ